MSEPSDSVLQGVARRELVQTGNHGSVRAARYTGLRTNSPEESRIHAEARLGPVESAESQRTRKLPIELTVGAESQFRPKP